MRGKGITYETGFSRGTAKRNTPWNLDDVAADLRTIRDDLHCTAVRIVGGDPGRIDDATRVAARIGLEVWYSPYPLELTHDEILALLADCAERAERLRSGGARVVFVAGAELSLMNPGFLPGATFDDRIRPLLTEPASAREHIVGAGRLVNAFLVRAVGVVRERFGGPVTYASVPLDRVDWTPFDIVSVDLYRSAATAGVFADGVRTLVAQGKPVAITEFGSATFRGAPDVGAQGFEIVENDPETGAPARLTGEYVRDEAGQAACVRELLEIFDAEGVDTTFVFAFALRDFPRRPDGDSRLDLDLASYGITPVFEDGRWEPKEAFAAVAESYGR